MGDLRWKYGKRAERGKVSELESRLGLRFPEDYVEVLLEHDGGRPRPGALALEGRGELYFERLLPLEGRESILEVAEALRAQGWTDLLPFGRDPFGNLFCFRYQGSDPGSVVYWEHETGVVRPLAPTLSDLLSRLREPSA